MNPEKPSTSARNRTPRPVDPNEYVQIQTVRLAAFFSVYPSDPHPEMVPAALKVIYDLGLHASPVHRHGIAGALDGLAKLHPLYVPQWRAAQPKVYAHTDRLRPPDGDSDITQAGTVDYLWMLALMINDEHPVERIIRLGQRQDPVGNAAVMLIHQNAAAPLMMSVLQKAVASRKIEVVDLPKNLPTDDIMRLTHEAAQHPLWSSVVLYVGYQPGATQKLAGTIVVTTPDGKLPAGFPAEWGGRVVVGRTATAGELAKWHKLKGDKDTP